MNRGLRDLAARSAAGTSDPQLRENLLRATGTIREKRAAAVAEVPDWEELRAAGSAIKDHALATLGDQLVLLEEQVVAAGGHVHWAADAAEANAAVVKIARDHGIAEVVKAKSIATDEIEPNAALAAAGIVAHETDLAELIVQLAGESGSHILVPALHKNRDEIRELFERHLTGGAPIASDPAALAGVARTYLRSLFLKAEMGVSGANFAIAETGTICVVESEGNARMCTTLPRVLVTVMGIEKVIAQWADLATMLTLLPRSSTGERMNPYTSLWTGVTPLNGPQEFHLVLLDNGRADALADPVGKQALKCIRCSACLNVCPVYERIGGHAYDSVYQGPIGAILSPQLDPERHGALAWASTLCGACADVCPVRIEIPRLLIHLRAKVPQGGRGDDAAMRMAAYAMRDRRRFELAQRLVRSLMAGLAFKRVRRVASRMTGGWSLSRELPDPPGRSFRARRRKERS